MKKSNRDNKNKNKVELEINKKAFIKFCKEREKIADEVIEKMEAYEKKNFKIIYLDNFLNLYPLSERRGKERLVMDNLEKCEFAFIDNRKSKVGFNGFYKVII